MKGNKHLKCVICDKDLGNSTGNICKTCEEEWDDRSGGEIYVGSIDLKDIKKAEAKI